MAIDPALLAALTSGATAGAKTANTTSSTTGIDWGAAKKNQPGAWSLGQSIIDILSTGGYASAGITRKVGENVSAIQRGDLGGLLDLLNPLSVVPAAVKGVQERRTYSENLRNLGVEDKTATWLGLALDIGLDPTTYITGGTIAGVKGAAAGTRLAAQANKANAKVVRSATEAAANNLPDVSRPFIPVEEPLSKGQKLGNYLTGILRGYEFQRSARSAEIANTKLAKAIQKDAKKTGDVDLADEALSSLEFARKNSKVDISDNVALINRDALMKAISENETIRAKFAGKLGKLEKSMKAAEDTRFVDPKAAQAQKVADLDNGAVAPAAAADVAKPAEAEALENAIVAETRVDNEELAAALKKQKLAIRTLKTSVTKGQTSFGKIADEVLDFAKRTTDPTTGRKLSESAGTPDELMEYISAQLAAGKIIPTANRTARFARALGVSSDPQQSVVDLVGKTLVKMQKSLAKIRDQEEMVSEANQLVRALESNFVNAKTENVVAATGASNAAEAGAKLEETMELEQEVVNSVGDIINTEVLDVASDGAKTAEELVDNATDLRALPAEQMIDDLDWIQRGRFSSTAGYLQSTLQSILPSMATPIARLAARMEMTVDELLDAALDGDKSVLNSPEFTLTKDAVRLDVINTEARFDIYDKVVADVRSKQGKNNRSVGDSLEEEARTLRASENLLRMFGIPVRTQENLVMQLARDGQKFVGDKLSTNFKPTESNITLSDIEMAAINAGKADALAVLRFPGKKYQNVMPSNFEYAYLTIARYKELGEEIVPGSAAWDDVMKALNQNYTFKFEDGLRGKKTPVEDFFIEAPHLKPGKTPKGTQLARIPGLEKKLEAAVKVMVDSADELATINATRAAARVADTVAEVMPDVRNLFADMVRFWTIRDSFVTNMIRLAQTPPLPGGKLAIEEGARAQNIPGINQLKYTMKKLIKTAAVGAKSFKDPAIAGEVSDLIINMFMKSLVGGVAKGPIDQLDPAKQIQLRNFIVRHMSEVREQVKLELDLVDATGGAMRPSTKVTPKQKAAGKNARRKSNEAKGEEAASLVGPAVKGQDDAMEAASNAAKPGPADETTIPSNSAAGSTDPVVAGGENMMSTMIKALTDLKMNEKFMVAFSGRYGLGLGLKVIVGGIEYFNHSKVGWFNNGLRSILNKYNKDIPTLNSSFKLVQQWGKAMAQRADQDIAEVPFMEWAKTADTTGINMEAAEDFALAIDGLFGVDGVISGANTITQPYYADELNRMFAMRGFWEIGEEQAFKLPPDLGPMGIKYSWARADLDDKFDSLTFMSNYASALHAVQTRIGIGQSFSSLFGKTAADIANEGLDKKMFTKIDPEDEFGKFLDPDKLYDASELKRLEFLKNYVTYEKSFRGSMQRIVDISDLTTSVLKASHTTWRPGHHVTSIVGEAIMNSLAGVNSPKYYGNAVEILRKFDPSMYKGDENAFKQYMAAGSPTGMQVKGDVADTVGYINSATGKRTVVSGEAIAAAAERLGILTRGGASTVEDLDLRGVAELGTGFVGGVSRINAKLADFSSHRDNFFRMAHFIKEIEKGGIYGSFEEAAVAAAKQVTTYHPTVGGLSAFERKYMRRAVFFYTWQRIAATKVFQLMVEKPGAIIVPSKIQYAFAEANGFNPESFGDPWDPDGVYASWNTGSTFGPQFQGPAGKGDAWGFGPAIPQLDILNSLFLGYTVQPGQSGLDALTRGTQTLAGNNLSPLPKWFAELTTGNRVGTGGDIRNPIEYAVDQVGGINTISKLTGIGQEEEKTLTPTEQAEKEARLLTNWFLGQKLQDYSTSQTIKQWKNDQREFMKRLTEQGQ
jgi:hypothetical protein